MKREQITVYPEFKQMVNIACEITKSDEDDLMNDFFSDCFNKWLKTVITSDEYTEYLNQTSGLFRVSGELVRQLTRPSQV